MISPAPSIPCAVKGLLLTSPSIPIAGVVVLDIGLLLLTFTGIPISVVKMMWLHYNSTWKVGIALVVLHR